MRSTRLWFTVQGRYWKTIVYSAANGRIEIRARSRNGTATHGLDKTSTTAQVGTVFAAL